MPIEIERKFLVNGTAWRNQALGRQHLLQAYFTSADHISVRVRIIDAARATLTVKLPRSGFSRFEFEQEVSLHEGLTLMDLTDGQAIEKNRHTVKHGRNSWVIDSYLGENRGLVVAEIELRHENEPFARPEWLGRDVTGVERYQNSTLARHPFRSWPEQLQLSRTA